MNPMLRKSLWLGDWYVIEPHHGSGQPEGTAAEWRAILEAMRRRERESFTRIGVKFDRDGNALFRSPRNSMTDNEAMISASEVDAWIRYAEDVLDKGAEEKKEEVEG